MSIKELPRATSRLLSSSQVFATPASLVKELLDNALDAKATSVCIMITANTLDKIEVRDNGHGIPSDDLSVIGKRGHTSKLRTFNELKTLGGLSLGFRGEALASAVELGDVSISTRVEGEAVATAIKLNARGGLGGQSPVSHPVGTTVCVTNLFSKLPVRKQTALKDARKTISRIKEMLQSYAVARLDVRLSLKVFKVQDGSWSFSPRKNESTREAMSHVIGRETAAQCVELISSLQFPSQLDAGARGLGHDTPAISNGIKSSEMLPQPRFIIQAFLPKLDANLTQIGGAQYVSIDSRPVSSARGIAKKLICIYKTTMSTTLGDAEKVKSPFMRLNIICPAGSYDPNVEPAKDDVLFEDETTILSLIEDWFGNFYNGRILATAPPNKMPTTSTVARDMAHAVPQMETLMTSHDDLTYPETGIRIFKPSNMTAKDDTGTDNSFSVVNPDRGIANRVGLPTSPEISDALQAVNKPILGFDMSEIYSEEVEPDYREHTFDCDLPTAEDARNKQTAGAPNQLNPWLIAKLNAPVTKEKIRDPTLEDPAGKLTITKLPLTPFSHTTLHKLRPLERRSQRDIAVSDNFHCSIEGWLQKNHELSRDTPTYQHGGSLPSLERIDGVRTFKEMENAAIDSEISFTMLRSPFTTQSISATRFPQNAGVPKISPVRDSNPGFRSAPERTCKSKLSGRPQSINNFGIVLDAEIHAHAHGDKQRSEVLDALDFERRKEEATRKLRQKLLRSRPSTEVDSTQGKDSIASPPHDSRCHITSVPLHKYHEHTTSEKMRDVKPYETCLPDDDPRAYLIRRQKSTVTRPQIPMIGRKLKRAKTALLPLETIPDSTELHSLCQLASTNTMLVRKALLTSAIHDQYAKTGKQAKGLPMSIADTRVVEAKLRVLVSNWVQDTAGEEISVVFDLANLRGRSVAGT